MWDFIDILFTYCIGVIDKTAFGYFDTKLFKIGIIDFI